MRKQERLHTHTQTDSFFFLYVYLNPCLKMNKEVMKRKYSIPLWPKMGLENILNVI